MLAADSPADVIVVQRLTTSPPRVRYGRSPGKLAIGIVPLRLQLQEPAHGGRAEAIADQTHEIRGSAHSLGNQSLPGVDGVLLAHAVDAALWVDETDRSRIVHVRADLVLGRVELPGYVCEGVVRGADRLTGSP